MLHLILYTIEEYFKDYFRVGNETMKNIIKIISN